MKVAIYVSHTDRPLPCYGLLSVNRPVSLLPSSQSWTFLRSGDTAEFHLPEAVEQEIESRGFWAHTFGDGAPASRPAPHRPIGGVACHPEEQSKLFGRLTGANLLR